MFIDAFLALTVGFVFSVLFSPVLRTIALYFGIVAQPNPLVETHKLPTAYLGGIAVFLAFVIGLIVTGLSYQYISPLICIGLMTLLGVFDDIKQLSAIKKLLGQSLISVLALWLLFYFNEVQLSPLNFSLYLLWLIITTNAFNLIDVMDGLATGIGGIAFAGLFAVAFIGGFYSLGIVSITLSGALLGFLPFNYHRATMFLGDAGSLMIGFSFGLLTLMETSIRSDWHKFLLTSFLFAIPLFELAFVFVMRCSSGKAFWKGSRDHFSLRLLSLGWNVPYIVVITYAFGVAALVTTLILELHVSEAIKWAISLMVIGIVLFVSTRLSKIEVE